MPGDRDDDVKREIQLLNAAALRPLPVADLDTLVRFDRVAKRFRSNGVPFAATQFIRDHNEVLSALLASHASDVVWADDPNDRLDALHVSANWFAELGYGAALRLKPGISSAAATDGLRGTIGELALAALKYE